MKKIIVGSIISAVFVTQVLAADKAEVAKKLANPVAAMISVPIQVNYHQNIGINDEGNKWTTNIQPVVPMDISEDWNLISRTIIPIISHDTGGPAGTLNGLGDIIQSAWFSPKTPTDSGWIWGAGAAFLIPTGSDLSAEKWGVGPTALALKQTGHWSYGGLVNHIWSTGGSGNEDLSLTFVQPFLTYITDDAVTFALNTESTYNWKTEDWTVPLNLMVTKVTKIGGQLISYGGGVNYHVSAPDNAPEGWGARFLLTFIFPK